VQAALHEVMYAETREQAREAITRFAAYKLLDMAQARWRRLDGAHLLPLVRSGITFVDGVQQATKGRRAGARAA
jgi:hypothetical protein